MPHTHPFCVMFCDGDNPMQVATYFSFDKSTLSSWLKDISDECEIRDLVLESVSSSSFKKIGELKKYLLDKEFLIKELPYGQLCFVV